MTKFQWASIFLVTGSFLIMGIWDAIALYYEGRKATISYLITMGSFHVPFLVFFFGALAGHLFWPLAHYKDDIVQQSIIQITVDEHGKVIRSQHLPIERSD